MSRKKTQEEFIKKVYDLVGDEYTVLGEYINTYTKILMRHNTCGYEWEVRPDSFLAGSRCPKCSKNKKKTHEEFVKEVHDLVGDEYTVLEKYINNHTKILMRHNTCGYEWEITPLSFLRGCRCPICMRNLCRKTHERFVKEVYDLVGDEYTVLGEYINNHTKILMRHNTCGYEWEIEPRNFLSGIRCYKCNLLDKRRTHEQFVKEVHDLVGDEYTVLGEYINNHTKILMRHNTCGHEYKVVTSSFLKGTRCPMCCNSHIALKSKEIKTKLFIDKIYNLVGDEYTVLGNYEYSNKKVLMRHNVCGHEWEVKPNSFLHGTRCPKCSMVISSGYRLDITEFKKRVYDLVGDEYTVLGEYINNHTKILMRHNTCGYEWEVRPNSFLLHYNAIMSGSKERQGARCPNCKTKNTKNRYLDIIRQEKENK